MITGPNTNNKIGNVTKKNAESTTTVYKTNVIAFEGFNFSWDKKYNATADPPKAVGDIAEENSHIKINSMDFNQLNFLSDNNLNLAAIAIWRIKYKRREIRIPKRTLSFHSILLNSSQLNCL